MRRGRSVALAVLVVALLAGAAGPDTGGPPGSRSVDPRVGPPQPIGFAYGDDDGALAGLDAYARPGGLVVAGRVNYDREQFRRVAGAGGQVLVYLDPVVRNPHGRYHALMFEASVCGGPVPVWPGLPPTLRYGPLADFRPGGVLQHKLGCVLETMVAENPSIAGWFADDVGSRSHDPGVDHDALPVADRVAYREGAVALTATLRAVADRHGLVVLVNGTWEGGDVETDGGGHPDPAVDGNALADGGTVEYHDGQQAYFGRYLCSRQWAAASPVTRGAALGTVITRTESARVDYLATGCVARAAVQGDYRSVPPPWGPFTAPSR